MFGSYAWAQQSGGGRMTPRERFIEMLHGIRALSADRLAGIGRLLGARPSAIRMALAEIPVPQSPLVTAAEASLAGAPAWVLPHSMRTYLFGMLLARRDGIEVEPEQFLLVSLLHDLGLVYREGAECFAFRGAQRAHAILTAAGAEPARADRVADAITMHLNVRPAAATPEARLVRAGAGYDVIADRFNHVDPTTRREVITAWPRTDFAESLRTVMRDEARLHPETRIGFLCHRIGFLRLISDADRRFQ